MGVQGMTGWQRKTKLLHTNQHTSRAGAMHHQHSNTPGNTTPPWRATVSQRGRGDGHQVTVSPPQNSSITERKFFRRLVSYAVWAK